MAENVTLPPAGALGIMPWGRGPGRRIACPTW